ncbi:MAG: xylulokinase, partial [Chloroflexi bacterium]|nr:xylulokinase [Chloroflexota bacterium]
MAFILGLDVSTTGSKAILIDRKGVVLGTASSPHTLSTPKPLWSEQDPEMWWQAVIKSIRNLIAQTGVDPNEIEAIGLTGQMHGLVLLDS